MNSKDDCDNDNDFHAADDNGKFNDNHISKRLS